MFEFEVISEIAPVKCAPGVIEAVADVSEKLGISSHRMHSGAAHDTQIMASITKAGMIFVPSKEGKSHTPSEWTAMDDIRNGADTLLNTLTHLAGETV